MSSSQGYRQFLLILLAMGIAVPSLVVTLGVRRITGPIADLIAASKEVASGKFGQTISVRTGDELEELGNQFNLMSEQLQESYSDLERKVSGRTKELATLNEIAEVVSSSLDLDEILQNAMDKTLKAMELEEGGIYLLDEKAGDLVLALYRGMRPEVTDIVRRVSIGDGYSGRVAATGQLLVVDDISGDPRLASTSKATGGPASLASVPLIARGKVLGTFFATTVGRREFSKQELQLLTSIGRQIGVAIDNARLFSAEQRRAEQFRLINEAGRTITSILSVDELVKGIVQLVRDVLGYHIVMIALVEHDELVFRPELGADDGHSAVRLKIGGQGITSWVARTGEPVIVPDVTKEPRYVRIPPDSRTMSELAVPLKARESVIGVLDVGSEQLHAFDQSDLVVLQSLAYQAAVAIENARLYEQAQQLAVVEERNRLARDLHDSVTQAVYGVTLYAEAASRLLAAGNVTTAAEHLQDLRSTAQQALREMRSLIFELRPPVLEKEGLNAALQARLESVEGRAGVAAELKLEGTAPLSQELESGLYRIAQEALNNSLKHSQAHGVRLYLRRDEDIVILEVTDDGTGFDAEAGREHGGLGLRGMKERAAALGGKLDVQSTPGQGTTIRVEVNR